MKIISIINNKGGVAKTTTTQNFGAGLARKGYKVLIIDFDPQANLTTGCGISKFETPVASVLKGDIKEFPTIEISKNLYISPSNYESLTQLSNYLTQEPGGFAVLKDCIDEYLTGFDFVLIDCKPSLDILTQNAIVASDFAIICVFPDEYSAVGMKKVIETIYKANKRMGADVKKYKVLLTKMDQRTTLHEDVASKIKKIFSLDFFVL